MNRFAIFAVGHGPANPCGIFDMPCPANDLGAVSPFDMDSTNRLYVRGAMANVSGWRVRARHAVPLLKINSRRNLNNRT
jgi:hypothetical protein